MKSFSFIKIMLSLIVITAYLIGFSYYGAHAYEKIFNLSVGFNEGTKIGPVDVSGKTKLEALKTLNNEIEEWQKTKKITVQYVEDKGAFDHKLISFQQKKSVSEAAPEQENTLLTEVPVEKVKSDILLEFPKIDVQAFDFEALASDLQDIGAYLQTGESVIDLTVYATEDYKQSIVSEALVSLGSVSPNINEFIINFPSVTLKNHTAFSFNQWMESTNDTTLTEDELNMLSSLFYRLVLKTNFLILEKNQGTELPSFIELGYEAKISKVKELDFVFMNDNDIDYTLEMKVVNNKLYGAIKGVPFASEYNSLLKNKQTFSPKTILQFTPDLPFGEKTVLKTGSKGTMIQMFRQTNGKKEEKIAEDFYPPEHRVERHSSRAEPPPPPEEPVAEPEEEPDPPSEETPKDSEEEPPKGEEESPDNEKGKPDNPKDALTK
ncbi:hypothetical protein JOC78_001885 [Bacillus ectoiniformans]|uniref:VanW family protein n=1 Tax=Bacillus ectoiniformans TaxID=1494429 RepID=UPI00195CBA89|nr:VanW family protein [Bacillus ectoiniformans]MBM7648935.1 hypothetical protein [Bacillus ectoiniformans]